MRIQQRLNKQLPIPLYHQLKTLLIERIRNGDLKPHDCLPSEDSLAAQFSVSKATVRQALNELAFAGILRREQGKGTFVAEQKVELGPKELMSFTMEMRRYGFQPNSKVVQQDLIPAEGEVAEKLNLRAGKSVFRLKRLRLADGEPMGIQTAYIPSHFAPGLIKEDFEMGSLYHVLETRYGLVPSHARETYSAVRVKKHEARLLHVAEGSPGMAGQRLSYLKANLPLELVYSVMRGDRYKVILDLQRNTTMQF